MENFLLSEYLINSCTSLPIQYTLPELKFTHNNNKFQVRLDVEGFRSNDLRIFIENSCLNVIAKTLDGMKSSFNSYQLPSGLNESAVSVELSPDSVLQITIPSLRDVSKSPVIKQADKKIKLDSSE